MNEQTENRGNWPIIIMIMILSGVMVSGFLLYPRSEEARQNLLSSLGTTNHGEFVVPPSPLDILKMKDQEGNPWQIKDQKVKWRLVIPGKPACNEECQKLIHITRQVHISLGKYSRRLERIYLVEGDNIDPNSETVLEKHPFLKRIFTQDSLATILEKTNMAKVIAAPDAPLHAYLVDQNGLIMMTYTLANDGNEMIEDIKHLMKYSPGK